MVGDGFGPAGELWFALRARAVRRGSVICEGLERYPIRQLRLIGSSAFFIKTLERGRF